MLVTTYDLEVTSPPCDPGTERWSAFARLTEDIREVLPYLNGRLARCIYDDETKVLTWHTKGHAVSIRPFEIAVSNLGNRDEARDAVDEIVSLINETWEQRAGLEPNRRKRRRLNPYQVYSLLPGDNCKLCGEATCLAFATKLALGNAELAQCEPLAADERREQRERLQAMLDMAA